MRKLLIIGGGLISLVLVAILVLVVTLFSNIPERILSIFNIGNLNTQAMNIISSTQDKANTQLANFFAKPDTTGKSDTNSCVLFNQKLDALSQKGTGKISFLDGIIADQVTTIKAAVEKAPESGKAMACQKAADALDLLLN